MTHPCKTLPSPVGLLTLVASNKGLVAILWETERPNRVRLNELTPVDRHPVLDETARQLGQYFTGARQSFDLPLDFIGTEFQQKVWKALLTIPYGETRSHSQIAIQTDHPKAVRAVEAANGRNPLSLVVPCHRVTGASGGLTGFAGGSLAKQVLLTVERGAASMPNGMGAPGMHNKWVGADQQSLDF